LADLQIDEAADAQYPVTASFERVGGNSISTRVVKARYAVGCDGARSEVRRSLGLALQGKPPIKHGVMDVLAISDFPDLRKKA
jgi:phenol 2-monooxygenase